ILEHAQRRRKLVEFGHSVGAWPLKADDDDNIAAEFAGLEGGEHLVLIRKAPSRGFDQPSILVDGTGFYYCAAKITAEQPETAVGPERLRYRPQHVDIGAFFGSLPDELVAVQFGIADPRIEGCSASGKRVAVDQSFTAQRVGYKRHSARVLKIIHVV